jgi:hypothetical protein
LVAAGCSGGDWDAVEEKWTLPRYYAMIKHWKTNGPPVYMAVAGYLGLIKPEAKTGSLDELARSFMGTGGFIQ